MRANAISIRAGFASLEKKAAEKLADLDAAQKQLYAAHAEAQAAADDVTAAQANADLCDRQASQREAKLARGATRKPRSRLDVLIEHALRGVVRNHTPGDPSRWGFGRGATPDFSGGDNAPHRLMRIDAMFSDAAAVIQAALQKVGTGPTRFDESLVVDPSDHTQTLEGGYIVSRPNRSDTRTPREGHTTVQSGATAPQPKLDQAGIALDVVT